MMRTLILVTVASFVWACGSGEGEDTGSGSGAQTANGAGNEVNAGPAKGPNSSHGLSGPLAIVSNGNILYGSVRQGKCEFTMVGAVGAHAIADKAEIYTGAGFFGKAVVDLAAPDSVGFTAAALPPGCETVFNKAQVAKGTRFKTTVKLSDDAIGFRTILADKTFFHNEKDPNVVGKAFVIKGQTVQVIGGLKDDPPGFVFAGFTAPGASQSTNGFLSTADVSPEKPLHDSAAGDGDGDGDGDSAGR